jgi:hypothetical protein
MGPVPGAPAARARLRATLVAAVAAALAAAGIAVL